MTTSAESDQEEARRALRRALGAFSTGVAVITTHSQGIDAGLTVNSFTSVSLDPPMVSWNLRESSPLNPLFSEAEHYAVHILSADQVEISQRFTRPDDRFAGLPVARGLGNIPLIADCCAVFECKNALRYKGGDHVIFIGEVTSHRCDDLDPLLFHSGKYANLRGISSSI